MRGRGLAARRSGLRGGAVELGYGAPPMVVSGVACRLWPAGGL
jgi:hypothetical protein